MPKMSWGWRAAAFIMGLQAFTAYWVGRVLFFRRRSNMHPLPIDMETVRTILIVRLDGIGDLVLSTGFLKEIRRQYPHARIVLVVKKEFLNLVELCPYVDQIQTFNARCSRFMQPILLPWRAVVMGRRVLAAYRFDLAINPRWSTDGSYASFLMYFAGAKWRLGYSEEVEHPRKACLNRGFDRFYTAVLVDQEPKHEVERGLDIIRFLGGKPGTGSPELWLSNGDHRFADSLCEALGRSWIVGLAPGAASKRRMWPLENFVSVGVWLKQHRDAGIIVLGSASEVELGRVIVETLPRQTVNAAGLTTLREAAAVLARCSLFIGNDSGLLHIASAAGIAVVEVSCHPRGGSDQNSHSPVRFGPWSHRRMILQPGKPVPPCVESCESEEAHCIKQIPPDSVSKAIERLCPPATERISG